MLQPFEPSEKLPIPNCCIPSVTDERRSLNVNLPWVSPGVRVTPGYPQGYPAGYPRGILPDPKGQPGYLPNLTRPCQTLPPMTSGRPQRPARGVGASFRASAPELPKNASRRATEGLQHCQTRHSDEQKILPRTLPTGRGYLRDARRQENPYVNPSWGTPPVTRGGLPGGGPGDPSGELQGKTKKRSKYPKSTSGGSSKAF